jgi:hypothetical protein
MIRLVVFVLLVGAIGFGAYMFLFRKAEATRTVKGYKKAETPQIAADMFKRAVEKREYDMAAFYCTTGFAEQLNRGAAAGSKLATQIDNLTYQMKERSLMRDEVKNVLYLLDPFPKELQITVAKESGDTAEATLVFSGPGLSGDNPSAGTWALKPEMFLVFVRSMKFKTPNTVLVPMKKVPGEKKDDFEWKFDFPVDNSLQLRVGYLNDKHMNYVNPLEIVTQEVKNDPATRENVTNRLKTLLEQAAKE